MEQNVALDTARREAETAICARNDFLAVMNHEMRTPMHAIIALSSLLQETQLTPEQRSMVDTILKSSNLLATLINDVLDLSRLEDGSLELEARKFALSNVFKEVWHVDLNHLYYKSIGASYVRGQFTGWGCRYLVNSTESQDFTPSIATTLKQHVAERS